MVHEFLHFLTRRPTRVCQLFSLTNRFKVIDSLMQDVGSQVTRKHIGPDPLFLEPEYCNKVTAHSDTLSVFRQLRSWLCVGMFCNILCELYADTRSDVSVYSDNESMDSDSDVPTTSSHKQLQSSTGPLTPQFPHAFFLTSNKTIFIAV
jgi:hypothetical protein